MMFVEWSSSDSHSTCVVWLLLTRLHMHCSTFLAIFFPKKEVKFCSSIKLFEQWINEIRPFSNKEKKNLADEWWILISGQSWLAFYIWSLINLLINLTRWIGVWSSNKYKHWYMFIFLTRQFHTWLSKFLKYLNDIEIVDFSLFSYLCYESRQNEKTWSKFSKYLNNIE